MRIGVDIRSLIEPFPSGVSEYTFNVLKYILSHDKENKYILFYNAKTEIDEKYSKIFSGNNVELKIWRWPNKFFNLALFIGAFFKIDKMIGGVDIFYMPNVNFFSISRKVKMILTVHDLSFLYPKYYNFKSGLWHKFIRPKQSIERANKIIAVSESTKNDLVENYNISRDKVQVIYSGVDIKKYENLDNDKFERIKNRYKLDGNFFLYLGNVENRKNIEGIINAWEKLNIVHTYQLVIAGRINDSKIVKDYPDVNFINYVHENDKAYLYKLAKAFVYPSFYEGFGLPVLEAMAAGCPVITSNSTSLPEVAQKAALLVDPHNIEEIYKAMNDIIINIELRRTLVNNAFSHIEKFNWNNTANQMIKLFKEV
ncbi:MAG: glycosyltransferase family 4 protein [Candidatus Kerfeldbacteria bacterium]|jgi:glycosyltransferase involved in cell wall biosynthesis